MSGGSRKQAETNLDVFKWQDDLEIEIVFSSVGSMFIWTEELDERVAVGASDKYEARCRDCFVPHADAPTVHV